MFVSGIHSLHSCLEFQASTPYSYQKLELPESGTLHRPCIMVALMPMPSLQLQEKTSLMQKSRGFGYGGVVSKICYNILYIDCAPVWLLQTKLLASVGWKWGCQPFSCRCSDVRRMWRIAERRFVLHVCLRNPFSPFRFGIPSIHSLLVPEAWASWERQYALPALQCGRIMPMPSLQLQKKNSLMQRSRGFGHGVVAYKIYYVQYSDCVQDLDCGFLIVLSGVTCDCCKLTNHWRNWAFSIPGLQAGRPAFQLAMFAKCDALPKGDLLSCTCLFKESIPAILSWN